MYGLMQFSWKAIYAVVATLGWYTKQSSEEQLLPEERLRSPEEEVSVVSEKNLGFPKITKKIPC